MWKRVRHLLYPMRGALEAGLEQPWRRHNPPVDQEDPVEKVEVASRLVLFYDASSCGSDSRSRSGFPCLVVPSIPNFTAKSRFTAANKAVIHHRIGTYSEESSRLIRFWFLGQA